MTRFRRMTLILTLGLVAGPPMTYAHDWYPFECCSGDDCAPVLHEREGIAGSRVLTSKHGTVVVPHGFQTRLSKDAQAHVCIMRTPLGLIPVCVFRPEIM